MNWYYNKNYPKLVIIGGGFAGIELAKSLRNQNINVLLLDQYNHHTFQPLLYQVASGNLEPDAIAFPFRKIFQNQKNFRFRLAEVSSINAAQNAIASSIGTIPYDYLVIATGATTNFFGNEVIAQHAMPMKSISEALNLRNLLLQNLEEALLRTNKEDREPYTNFVVVGAGPTGVELAGALAELRDHILTKDYPELCKKEFNIYLIDALPRVLAALSAKSSNQAQRYLLAMGVTVLTEVKVASYDGTIIGFENGSQIKTKNVIWAAGVKGQVPKGLPKASIVAGNRIQTDALHRVKNHTNIFAIGDVAAMITEKTPKGHPGVAPVAIQQGRHLAKNIVRLIRGEEPQAFSYCDKGSMAIIGKHKAVVDIGAIHFHGLVAWLAWLLVHLVQLLSFRKQLIALINWIANYCHCNGDSRLIIQLLPKKPIA